MKALGDGIWGIEVQSPLIFFLLVLSFGCVGFQISGEIQQGRRALLNDKTEIALARFQSAARTDPSYTFTFSPFRPSVQSYVGRAYYAMGKLSEAKSALEKARKERPEDPFASLYLGLVLMRQGEAESGRRHAAAGLRSLRATLYYVADRTPEGRYWDPGRKIEAELDRLLASVESADFRSNGLIPRLEQIGYEIDEEIDRAREDRSIDLRETDNGPTD